SPSVCSTFTPSPFLCSSLHPPPPPSPPFPYTTLFRSDSARGALDQLPEFRPDLVVLDIKMPEIDGLEVLRRIKRIDPTIEVVMIDRKSTRLNSSHRTISYAVFCLKKKKRK